MYLFADTETNGLPKKKGAPVTDVDNFPRITQLGFIVVDKNWNEQAYFNELIKPDGWTIPSVSQFISEGYSQEIAEKKAEFWTKHGYSTEINEAKGISAQRALAAFTYCMERVTHIVCHNIEFDVPIIGAEMIRYGVKCVNRPKRLCTMQKSKIWCEAKDKLGRLKNPNLGELHTKLFGIGFDGAHDAMSDVSATVRCAKALEELGVISFD